MFVGWSSDKTEKYILVLLYLYLKGTTEEKEQLDKEKIVKRELTTARINVGPNPL